MDKQARSLIDFRVRYDGAGPVYWNGSPRDFGLQDKSEVLHQGEPDAQGGMAFAFALELKPENSPNPVFIGAFAHGPPAGRFLYLGWRNREGAFAQRLKIPLGSIGWDTVRQARSRGKPLVCMLVDRHPKATSTGANIGGTRHVTWEAREQDAAGQQRQGRR